MGKLPIVYGGETIGEAEITQSGLYTRLSVRVAPRRGLWRAWAVGDAGEVRIGTLEPADGESAVSRRFSRLALSEAGELSRVELRPDNVAPTLAETRTRSDESAAAQKPQGTRTDAKSDGGSVAESAEAWRRPEPGQRLFRNVRFRRQLRGVRGALTRTDGERRRVALVREDGAPFPLPELFCLVSAARIGAKDYWVFSFDRQGWPVF